MKRVRCCKVPGCFRKHCAKGYCKRHYQQMSRSGKISSVVVKRVRCCKVTGCYREHRAKGYCGRHYYQIETHGKILERTRHTPNEIIDYGDYVGIILYNKKQKKIAESFIDKCDVPLIENQRCFLCNGYATINIDKKQQKRKTIHQLIFPEHVVTDHKDRKPLNNRRYNLRECTPAENTRNRHIQCNNTSGVPGVMLTRSKKWVVYIKANKIRKYLGRFSTLEEATKVRRKAEEMYYKEFAPQNFPLNGRNEDGE